MLFFDFEVFKHDWLVVIMDMDKCSEHVIVNDPDALRKIYNSKVDNIWAGYNSRNYDQFILRAILCGFNPKNVNDFIILQGKSGWAYSNLFYQIPFINYDVMPNPPIGLKTLETMMGNDIRESSVPFNIDRKLTDAEIQETVKYCRHDVEQTIEVFLQRKSEFDAMIQMCKVFNLPISYIGKSEAGITAKVLDCVKTDRQDEYDFHIEPFIKLKKYNAIMEWFKNAKRDCVNEMVSARLDPNDPDAFRKFFYNRSITTNICGIPHVDGWGGIHGASEKPLYSKGSIWHIDVNSYYPSYLIAHNRLTRSARKPDMYKHVYETRLALKASGKKKEQAPYKKILNSLSGAMKDPNNPAYDPGMNNTMVVNCQLMLVMLLEWLEDGVDGFTLIQSNTDGLIVQIPDTEEAFNQLDDVCYAWESACSTKNGLITLAFDEVDWIYQKDVNNYLFKFAGSDVYERKGAYVKSLSRLDNDLPIVNRAVVDYMTLGIHPAKTITACDDLIQFQKVVKLSEKFDFVEHNRQRYTNKCYRVFASSQKSDGQIRRVKNGVGSPVKFGNTPDKCFIVNDDVNGMKCPSYLDKRWYINLAVKRLNDFGVVV